VVHAAAVGSLPEPALEALGSKVEGLVEILCAGLGADDRAACAAGDFDVLAAAVLAWILLVLEFDVSANDLVVVSLQFPELLSDVLPVMVGHNHVAPTNHDFHPACGGTASWFAGRVHATSSSPVLDVGFSVRSSSR
jgi:hypothetical protein